MANEELLQLKSSVDVVSVLTSYGATFLGSPNGKIRSSCVVHGGSNPSSLVYDISTGFFKCFSCNFRGDIFSLVQHIEKCSFKTAVDRVRAYSNGSSNGYTLKKETSVNKEIEMLHKAYGSEELKNTEIYSPLVERALLYRPNPYEESGMFSKETVDTFELGYCDFNEYFMNRIIIPIHNEYGKLIGFSGRATENSTEEKYRIKKGFRKGYCLYNMHRALPYLSRKNPMVLVEGFGQTWRLWESGIKTVVALMGKDLTSEQYALILQNTTSLVLALDFDSPGTEATEKLVKMLDDKIDLKVVVSDLEPNIDLADMSNEKAKRLYHEAVPAYYWFGNIYKKAS